MAKRNKAYRMRVQGMFGKAQDDFNEWFNKEGNKRRQTKESFQRGQVLLHQYKRMWRIRKHIYL